MGVFYFYEPGVVLYSKKNKKKQINIWVFRDMCLHIISSSRGIVNEGFILSQTGVQLLVACRRSKIQDTFGMMCLISGGLPGVFWGFQRPLYKPGVSGNPRRSPDSRPNDLKTWFTLSWEASSFWRTVRWRYLFPSCTATSSFTKARLPKPVS